MLRCACAPAAATFLLDGCHGHACQLSRMMSLLGSFSASGKPCQVTAKASVHESELLVLCRFCCLQVISRPAVHVGTRASLLQRRQCAILS
jgi:hypothetical protein